MRDGWTGISVPAPTVIVAPYTGDYRIDTLLAGLEYRWNYPQPLGTAVTITYSFMGAAPTYGGNVTDSGDFGFSGFNVQQRTAVRQIMERLEAELGIDLDEVDDSALRYGQIRFGNNTQPESAGYAWLPNSTGGDNRDGDVWIDNSSPGNMVQVSPGTTGWATLVHEIGHALGLKHPGNYNAGQAQPSASDNYLGTAEDNHNYTVMSYVNAAGGQPRDWFGIYDLLTLKTLYGAGPYNTGATTYSYTDSSGATLGIIDDASGFDTIDLSAVTLAATVDMRPGAFSSIGRDGFVPAMNNLSIDLSTIIEKIVGTPFSDRVTGNDANNEFFLGAGENMVDGGGGLDFARYAFARLGYQVAIAGTLATVIGGGANDSLASVERLMFSDRNVALDVGGHAGTTAKIIGAVFGSSSVAAHPEYVSIGLGSLDAGTTYHNLMQFALDARLGVQPSNAEVVQLLYTNVVGTPPPAEDLALFQGWLDSGSHTQATLAIFAAETALNAVNIDLAGLASHGLDFF